MSEKSVEELSEVINKILLLISSLQAQINLLDDATKDNTEAVITLARILESKL